MKSIKFLFALLTLTISLVACDAGNEPLDPALLNQLPATDTCVTPTNLQTSPLNNGTTINLTWTTSGIATAWQVEYGLSETYIQGAGTKIPASAATVSINNLFAVNSYTFSVRAICGSGFGDWSNPVNVVGINPNCANPSGLSVVRSTTNPAEATVNWTAPATQTAWEISYGAAGFNPSQGTNTVQATIKPKTVSGLATTSYDFYVRAKCSATETSNWVGPINLVAVTAGGTNVVGTYILTQFNTTPATDLNLDGTPSVNQLQETICFNNSLLKLNADNTFVINSKGVDINITNNTITCSTDPDELGTWSLTGNQLLLINPSFPQEPLLFTLSGNILTSQSTPALIVSNTGGVFNFVPATSAIFVYTKQ